MSQALHLLELAAAEFDAYAEEKTADKGIFSLSLKLSDGYVLLYKLEVSVTSRGVTAREVVPQILPAFCPQRHINGDGTFCLYWSEAVEMEISSLDRAKEWWGILFNYLRLQARAERQRKWPNNNDWAHGEAAWHQQTAMDAAVRLGPQFSKALSESAITVTSQPKRQKSQGPTLHVFVHGQHTYSVWLNSGKVVNRKQSCFCGISGLRRPAKLRSCKNHADDAAELALSIKKWHEAEQKFWSTFNNRTCCGTCNNCPLTKNSDK